MMLRANLKSLGKLPEGPIAPAKIPEPQVIYPKVTMNSKQIEGLKDVDIGDTIFLVVEAEVEVAGKGEEEYDSSESDERWVKLVLKRGKIKVEEDEAEREVELEHELIKKPMSKMYGQ